MPLSPARLAAFHILLRVIREDSYATELLHSHLTDSLQPRDLRLATELVFGVLRQQSLLDHVLTPLSRTTLARLDTEVQVALRLGAYQVLFLDRVPSRAAIHESVELVKKAKLRSASGYVNAVLRKVSRADFEKQLSEWPLDSAAGLALRYSHPEWLVKRWKERFGSEKLIQLLQHNNEPPAVYFRSNAADVSAERLKAELEQQPVYVKSHPLSSDILEVVEGDLYATPLFRDGKIAVQDAGSQVIPRLLAAKPSDRCLDLCCGTGGKASQMARLQESATPIIASDLHGHRLRTARQLHSAEWPQLHWVAADATRPLPFQAEFDKILLDVPCSGTGTLQRHPEIRWRLEPGRLVELASLQRALLENAVGYMKPGGLLVYSSCSLEPEENEGVVDWLLAGHPELHLVLPESRPLSDLFDSRKLLHFFPPQTRTDGFFAAVIRRQVR